MPKTYILLVAALSLSLIYLSSCSASREASTSGSQQRAIYPGWYSVSDETASTQTGFFAYGTAVAGDSSDAVEKAVTKALSNLEQHISERLESVRNDVARSSEDGSGLDSSTFVFALRNAEGGISGLASVSQTEVRPNSNSAGFYGFAEVTLTRQELLAYLNSELSSNQAQWEALKKRIE